MSRLLIIFLQAKSAESNKFFDVTKFCVGVKAQVSNLRFNYD